MKWFYDFLDETQLAIMAVLIKLGVFFVPLMPASFLGFSVWSFYQGAVGLWFGVISALAIEIIGLVVADTALKTVDAWQKKLVRGWKAAVMGAILPVSAAVTAAVIFYSDGAFPEVIRSLGIAGAFMTMFIYIALAIGRSVDNAKAEKEAEKAERKQRKISVEKSVESSGGISTQDSGFPVMGVQEIMSRYNVKKSRAYEIRAEQAAGTWRDE